MHIGEKIRLIRESKELSQDYISLKLGLTQGHLSQIESGQAECKGDLLKNIKAVLEVENAPLTEEELIAFRNQLNYWCDIIRNRNLVKARLLCNEAAAILNLEFEKNLVALYRLFEIKLLVLESGKIDEAEKILGIVASSLDEMSEEVLYHYYFNRGFLHMYRREYKTALDYNLKAYSYYQASFDKEPALFNNIAACYARLGKPFHSIRFLERASGMLDNERVSISRLNINSTLAINYIRLNEFGLANDLLTKCLSDAKSIGDWKQYGVVLHNFGCLHHKMNENKISINYFDQAFEYFEENEQHYLENLYCKIRCLINIKKFDECISLLSKAGKLTKSNEVYMLQFESLHHIIKRHEVDSCQFLYDISIPKLLEAGKHFVALDYCEILIATHKRNRRPKKEAEVKALSAEIYKRIIYGGEF